MLYLSQGIHSHSISKDFSNILSVTSRVADSIRLKSTRVLFIQPPNIHTSHHHAILRHPPLAPRNARSCSGNFVRRFHLVCFLDSNLVDFRSTHASSTRDAVTSTRETKSSEHASATSAKASHTGAAAAVNVGDMGVVMAGVLGVAALL
jgi:hypothetical protein